MSLDSVDPDDVARLKALGIEKEQANILSAFFFPKQTRIIAYSPEPGRFVEAQTTFNPDYPSHKTDTTIIQIQEKQLSSDHHAMQRQIVDERTSPPVSSKLIQESELIVAAPAAETSTALKKDKSPPIERKKRKSMSSASLLSCFKSKKPKAGTEQLGQATLPANQTTTTTAVAAASKSAVPEKPMIDYAVLPDGKRIYIDAFRERTGMDMSYRPDDFERRFILPTVRISLKQLVLAIQWINFPPASRIPSPLSSYLNYLHSLAETGGRIRTIDGIRDRRRTSGKKSSSVRRGTDHRTGAAAEQSAAHRCSSPGENRGDLRDQVTGLGLARCSCSAARSGIGQARTLANISHV